jgi:hypothetical protein
LINPCDGNNRMTMTGEQIRLRGLAALRKELGRAGLVRFLEHFEAGQGDYTSVRSKLLAGLTMEELRQRTVLPRKKASRRK